MLFRSGQHKNGRRLFAMGIRESLTLTWQDLDQSPLSLFTYCEEAMATKPNTNLSTARLWNANTQATYHRMMEKMQALYYHLQRFTQCLLNRGVQSIVLFYWFGLCCYIQHLTSKGNLLSTDNILQKTVEIGRAHV